MTKAPIIDTHAHLTDPVFDGERNKVLRRAQQAGVVAIINPGSSLSNSLAAVAYARATPGVFAGVGLHPHEVPGQHTADGHTDQSAKLRLKLASTRDQPMITHDIDQMLAKLEQLARDPVVVAIGEFGLDLKSDGTDLDVQKKALVAQLKLANERSLPIILHCRSVYDDLEKILSKYRPRVPGIVHCFTGNTEQAQRLMGLGLYLSVGGIITFKNNTQALRQAVRQMPLERLLLETDSPYLSPEPKRGEQNEPARVARICQFIADLRQISYSELAEVTTANARKVFALSTK